MRNIPLNFVLSLVVGLILLLTSLEFVHAQDADDIESDDNFENPLLNPNFGFSNDGDTLSLSNLPGQFPSNIITENMRDITRGVRASLGKELADIRQLSNLSLASLSSPTRLNLLQFSVNPEVLDNGAQTIRSLDEIKKQLAQGNLNLANITEDHFPLAMETLRGIRSVFSSFSSLCQPSITQRCGKSPYRTINGECNNPHNPSWGRATTQLIRIQPNNYQDGVFSVRNLGRHGRQLPSPRMISTSCTSTGDSQPSSSFTLSVMQIGQFLDHDLVHVPIMRPSSGSGLECCSQRRKSRRSNFCFPISVPQNDPLYRKSHIRCMNFVRSIPFSQGQCRNRAAQQVNQITHFIDGSNVYGSSDEELSHLRESEGFRMLTSDGNRLPHLPEGEGGCEKSDDSEDCFVAGDSRVNEQPSLTLMHTIWVRLHNVIARQLKSLNRQSEASDEDIFQEARAIVIAIMQKIYYREWLPIIIGDSLVREMQLDEPVFYNPNIVPAIVNEFATAAFRFGHSLISGRIGLYNHNGVRSSDFIRLSDSYFQPGPILEKQKQKSGLIMGLCHQPMQRMDNQFTVDIAGKLFRGENKLGLDLISLNIQRGRDHAIGSYVQTRTRYSSVCPELAEVKDWSDLSPIIPAEKVRLLQRSYQSVDDIDLFIGGIMEEAQNGALVGPTFACIIADQFARLKHGDRHFYNHRETMFSDGQLKSIESMTWSHVLCSANQITSIPRDAFRITGRNNEHVSCQRMPLMDMSPWKQALPRQ